MFHWDERTGRRLRWMGGTLFVTATCGVIYSFAEGGVRNLVLENRSEEALTLCRQYETSPVIDNDTKMACAWAFLRADKLESGEKLIEGFVRTGNVSPEVQLLAAYAKMKRKRFPEARQALQALGNEFKSGALALMIQETSAELYEQQGQLDTAAFIYKQIVSDSPQRGRAHWGLARFYLAKGEAARARTHLAETARLWPKHLGSRYNLAMISIAEENYSEAARWLAESYRLDKADPGVLEQMGVLFEKKGMMEQAIKYWQRAMSVGKDAPLAKAKLGQYGGNVVETLYSKGDWQGVVDKISAGGPTLLASDPSLTLKRGVALRNLGKHKKALVDLVGYLKRDPKNGLAYREAGIAYLNLKLIDKAGTSFSKAIEVEPTNGMNFAWMGFMLEQRKDYGRAVEAWRKAAELLTEPDELRKATRRLASLEKRLGKERKKRDQDREENEDEESSFDENLFQ